MTGEWLWALYVSISRTDPFLMYQYQELTPFSDPFLTPFGEAEDLGNWACFDKTDREKGGIG
jgi:hypothetical protein